MPKCTRCNQFRPGFLLINGYCAKCFESSIKETEHKRIREGSERSVIAEKQCSFVQERSAEIKQTKEENDKRSAADMERFIAEQNASSDFCEAPCASAAYQRTMTEEDVENTALLWFPEKAEIINKEIDNAEDFLYGYLDGDFPKTLITLLEEWKDHLLIWKYCAFMELIWRNGDPHMLNALSVTAIETLASHGGPAWVRFGYYLSNEFRTWINDVSVRGNIMLDHGCGITRLTSLNGQDLPVYRLQPGHQVKEPGQEDNVFMLGSYHIIGGRIVRFCNHPEQLQMACRDLGWVNIHSEHHRFVFRNGKGLNDCVHIVFSRFPAGCLRENIADAFLHSVLIIHQLIDTSASEGSTDMTHFSQSEDAWNAISAEQRYTDAATALKRFYDEICWKNALLDRNTETGTMELINMDSYSRCDEQACKKLVSLLTHLPANTALIGGNAKIHTEVTETYVGAEDDRFVTIILHETYT